MCNPTNEEIEMQMEAFLQQHFHDFPRSGTRWTNVTIITVLIFICSYLSHVIVEFGSMCYSIYDSLTGGPELNMPYIPGVPSGYVLAVCGCLFFYVVCIYLFTRYNLRNGMRSYIFLKRRQCPFWRC